MLAIAVLRSRVAPVLDWCSRFMIFPEDNPGLLVGQEVSLEGARPYEALKELRGMGVESLICGALTPELLEYSDHLGLQIIHGIAGAIPDVLKAYHGDELHHPGFWLPGCRGPCQYRKLNPVVCVCPRCGRESPHQRGIPCARMQCPNCQQPMCGKGP